MDQSSIENQKLFNYNISWCIMQKYFQILEFMQILKLNLLRNFQKSMSQQNIRHVTVRSEIAQHHLDCIFQELHALQMNVPIFDKIPKFIHSQKDGQLLQTCSTVHGLTNLLRVLRKKAKKVKKFAPVNFDEEEDIDRLPNIIFCRPVREVTRDEKVFWLLRNHQKKKLQLDLPKAVLVLPHAHLLTIQRKYINLYQIEQNLQISLKHFDSTGIGKRITLVDVKYTSYKNKDYVMIFRNQKQNFQVCFQALIYEIISSKLRFVKKCTILDKQVIDPVIFFEEYHTRKGLSKFCMILGGKDHTNSPYYNALQLNLHIFLDDFLTFEVGSTIVTSFTNKVPILSGKIIKYDHKWYAFCSEQQTINEITLQYEGNGILAHVAIKSQRLQFNEKFFFSEDSVKAIYDGDQEKVIFMDKHLNLNYKSFHKIILPFNS